MKIGKFYALIAVDLILLYVSFTNIFYNYGRWGIAKLKDKRIFGFLDYDEHYIGLAFIIPFIVLSIYLYRNAPLKKK